MKSIALILAQLTAQLTALNAQPRTPRKYNTLRKLNGTLKPLATRKNAFMPYFLPHSNLIVYSLANGVSVASIARHLHSKDASRYSTERAMYQALYKWINTYANKRHAF